MRAKQAGCEAINVSVHQCDRISRQCSVSEGGCSSTCLDLDLGAAVALGGVILADCSTMDMGRPSWQ